MSFLWKGRQGGEGDGLGGDGIIRNFFFISSLPVLKGFNQ